MNKKERIYITRDKRLDEIGVPINPHSKKERPWWLDMVAIPEVMVIAIIILVALVYLMIKLFKP